METYKYDAFGNLLTPQLLNSQTLQLVYAYTGREYDPESRLYFYRARYYDSKVGRFLQADPIGFLGGMNFYRYVGNNSINLIDPFGWCPEKESAVKQFLGDFSEQSALAGTACALAGVEPGAVLFYGISAVSTGLEITIYSQSRFGDTAKEVVKMFIPAKEPFNMITDKIIDVLNEKIQEINNRNQKK